MVRRSQASLGTALECRKSPARFLLRRRSCGWLWWRRPRCRPRISESVTVTGFALTKSEFMKGPKLGQGLSVEVFQGSLGVFRSHSLWYLKPGWGGEPPAPRREGGSSLFSLSSFGGLCVEEVSRFPRHYLSKAAPLFPESEMAYLFASTPHPRLGQVSAIRKSPESRPACYWICPTWLFSAELLFAGSCFLELGFYFLFFWLLIICREFLVVWFCFLFNFLISVLFPTVCDSPPLPKHYLSFI